MEKFAGRDLGNGLFLSHLANEHDIDQFIQCNQVVTGEGPIAERLIKHRPGANSDDFFIVRDTQTGEVISTTCLLPWQICYGGAMLKTAMLEMVVTHPEYRRKGLIRAQVQHFQRLVQERGYDLSIIQGIPNYYRQYGYGYALDHMASVRLPSWLIPDAEDDTPFVFDPPAQADMPVLADLYRQSMSHQEIYVERSADYWEYLINNMGRPLTLIRKSTEDQPVGYFWGHQRQGIFDIQENAISRLEYLPGIMAKLKREGVGEIQVTGNHTDPLFHWIEGLGGVTSVSDQWLINLPDPGKLIMKIGPVLENRLIAAGFCNLTTDITINFYRSALRLHFKDNRLTGVEDAGFLDASMSAVEWADLTISADAFVRLVFGYRVIDQLKDAWPDVLTQPKNRHILDALFPKASSLILMPY